MILLFGSLLVLLLIGVPVFVAIGASAVLYILVFGISPLMAVERMVAGVDSFTLLAVPFFILAANLMNASQVTDRLFAFAQSMVGHWRGGLAHVNVYGSVIFATMSGTAMADAGGLGTIELKAMKEHGYDRRFAVGLTAASSILGPIIPPSLALVVYGFVGNVSVGRLFLAGIVPGLLCALGLHLAVAVYARIKHLPQDARQPWSVRRAAFLRGAPALLMPVILIGGIMAGIMTPTEAAAAASAYALLLGFAYRSLDLRGLLRVLRESYDLTATLMLMVAASVLFGWILVHENVARDFTAFTLGLASEPWHAMLLIVAILLIAGMFLDPIAIILIAVPIFTPALTSFQIDPVQFGLVLVITLMIGLMTPPIGALLFVMSRISGLGYFTTFRACLPFLVPISIVLVLVMVFPPITLLLPNLVFGR